MVSVLARCPSYRESKKMTEERQGPTLDVPLIEVSVKRELKLSSSRIRRWCTE